jgi:hypothetical protein
MSDFSFDSEMLLIARHSIPIPKYEELSMNICMTILRFQIGYCCKRYKGFSDENEVI